MRAILPILQFFTSLRALKPNRVDRTSCKRRMMEKENKKEGLRRTTYFWPGQETGKKENIWRKKICCKRKTNHNTLELRRITLSWRCIIATD